MTPTPHDALFRAAFGQIEHAAAALRVLLPPDLVARIDFTSLTPCPGSFIDEGLAGSHSDLLFSVRIAGRSAFIYVLWEHQSSPDPLMPYRLLHYEVRIWEGFLRDHPHARKLPAIVPLVVHHGEKSWTAATTFDEVVDLDADTLSAVGAHLPRFRFLLDDLSREEDEALRARAMTALGRLVLLCFKYARDPDELVARLGRWADLVRDVWNAPNGAAALALLLRYIFAVGGERTAMALRELVAKEVSKEAEAAMMSYAEQLRREGFQQGEIKGRREGRHEVLLRLLRVRFGEVPEGVAARVAAAELEQLDAWIERILSAATLDDVFAGT